MSSYYITFQVLVSTNGTDWDQYLAPDFSNLSDLTYGNGQFLAVYYRANTGGTNGAFIYSSVDGITWNLKAVDRYTILYPNPPKLAAGNGLYALSSVNLEVSANLVDWTVITRDFSFLFQLRYGGSAFFGAISFGPITFSTDGQVWELTSPVSGRYFQSAAYASGRYGAFATASSDGAQPAVSAASLDLSNWQTVTLADSFTNSFGMTSAGDTFFLLNTVSNGFYSSKDALNWQQRSFGTNVAITDLAFGANTFVAVGDFILQSAPVTNTISAPALSLRPYPGLTINGTLGQHYEIQYTIDPSQINGFQPLTNILLNVNPYLWIDVTATNSERRFYRAVALP